MAEYNPSKIIKDGNTYNFRDDTKIPLAGSNQISGDLIPATTNVYDLGTSTNKWKSLNGIAPDELGLPTSTYTDVSSYITHFDSTPNTFTAPVSGFLNVVTDYTGDIACSVFNDTTGIQAGGNNTSGQVRVLLPLEQGNTITLYISKSGLSLARIYHLKGKV